MEKVTVQGVCAEVATTFFQRARGLIGRRGLEPGTGLLILHCNAIHTFFMRFPIDATFLDRNDRVVNFRFEIAGSRVHLDRIGRGARDSRVIDPSCRA